MLYNVMRDRMNPNGLELHPRYRLTWGVVIVQRDLGGTTPTTSHARILEFDLHYRLAWFASETDDALLEGVVSTFHGYRPEVDMVAGMMAEEAAKKRGFADLANQLRHRLALWFARRGSSLNEDSSAGR